MTLDDLGSRPFWMWDQSDLSSEPVFADRNDRNSTGNVRLNNETSVG
jgi:hypothetical protein